ncbi:MAG: alpha/beta hydrolase [Azonexus sp.]|jgi:pimeloyl-ACP methyl ester carboxylesterase|uniref:alpha/beta fold hydrolase n=1 Tax=Azonexus sp. TaxID=1872668 RepID=UPI002829F588|nr:alpha/beta hydrolase [Azonexus sp.]MDR0775597.1 alpha/beta hydrolase [Azonexus sp.]
MKFKQRHVQCLSPSGLHRMAYTEWGAHDNPRVLVCVHGLARNSRDFDDLAAALAGHYRVICPDVAGRGLSDRLRDAASYDIPQYVADMVALFARLDVERIDWLGTSMGGLIGMALAAFEGSPINRLVLNDVGPALPVGALRRIAGYVGADPTWVSFDEAVAYVRAVSEPFGPLSETQWRRLTESSVAQRTDGRWGFRYDSRIADGFRASFADEDIDLWGIYDRITCSTLAIRGAESDLLARAVWQSMGERGPRAVLVEIPGVGHAPMFLDEDQISIVRDFLLAP